MNMLALALIGAALSMATKPRAATAQTRSAQPTGPMRPVPPPPLPRPEPNMTESECASRGGIWTGTECLGAKSLQQIEAEKAARRERIRKETMERERYLDERRRFIADSRIAPANADTRVRRTVSSRESPSALLF